MERSNRARWSWQRLPFSLKAHSSILQIPRLMAQDIAPLLPLAALGLDPNPVPAFVIAFKPVLNPNQRLAARIRPTATTW